MGKRLTNEERAARALTEREFQKAYVAALRHLGFLVEHHYDSRFSDPGTRGAPDLKVVGHKHYFTVELKRWNGVLSDDQIIWLRQLEAAGISHWVCRPQDWASMMDHAERLARAPIPEELRAFPVPKKKKRRASTQKQGKPASG